MKLKNTEPKWVVIHIAHGEYRADKARELLEKEGFLCRLNPIARAAAAGETCFEVLALPGEAQEARDILQESSF